MAAVVGKHDWVEIGALADIPVLGARVVRRAGGDIAVFRTAADEVFALADACPHRGGPLSQGIVHGSAVTCPLHDWCIGLADGKAQAPDEGETLRYPVELRNGAVFLYLAANTKRQTPTQKSPQISANERK